MKYIDTMNAEENLSWCKPMYNKKHDIYIIVNSGKVMEAHHAGEYIRLDTEEDIVRLANIINEDYDLYSGWSATHILLDADWEELGCADCPCCDFCEAVNEEIDD